MSALGLRIGLRHIRSLLRFAVICRPVAVIHVAVRIHPHLPRTAACCLRRSCGLRRRRCLRRRGCNRSGSWSRHLRRCGSWRRHRAWRRSRDGRRSLRPRCRSLGRIPLLHALMSVASPLFAGGSRISSILALSCGSGRRLSHRRLHRQKPRGYRHQTNRCPHKRSR